MKHPKKVASSFSETKALQTSPRDPGRLAGSPNNFKKDFSQVF